MKQLWKFYKVSEGAGLASGRVGMAVLANAAEIDREPGRYKPFNKGRETALVDQAGLFTMFDQYLTPPDDAPPYPFFLRTCIGGAWYCPGVSNVTPLPADFCIANQALAAYGHLLPLNVMVTPAGFAAIIAGRYPTSGGQIESTVECLRRI